MLLPGAEDADDGVTEDADVVACESPARLVGGGAFVGAVSLLSARCRGG
jgi:hypothetical protein